MLQAANALGISEMLHPSASSAGISGSPPGSLHLSGAANTKVHFQKGSHFVPFCQEDHFRPAFPLLGNSSFLFIYIYCGVKKGGPYVLCFFLLLSSERKPVAFVGAPWWRWLSACWVSVHLAVREDIVTHPPVAPFTQTFGRSFWMWLFAGWDLLTPPGF